MTANPLSGDSLYRDIVTYAGLGEHRTATEPDLRTSEWIATEMKVAGFETRFLPFTTRQFFIRQTRLTIGSRSVPCFPLWPPHSTGPTPIRAPLTLLPDRVQSSLRGKIALAKFQHSANIYPGSGHEEAISQAAKAGALAVVGIASGPSGEIVAANSPKPNPWPIPVVVVGARDEPALTTTAEQDAEVTLLLDGTDEPWAEAKNVIGRLDGGKDFIVVSTPQSGWFRCAGERGPGIALFLGLARWVAQRRPRINYLFVSTSGHELGGQGMRNFLRGRFPPANEVLCWLHLGASIATWGWEETATGLQRRKERRGEVSLCSTPDLLPLLTSAFSGMPDLQPKTGPVSGELVLVIEAGYPSFGFFGRHRFFHTPADDPEVTAPELLEPIAMAIAKVLETIEAKGKP